ncbi:hypothetical protein Scep_003734 [Stephania cephalantha]|uniref:Cucumisin n=1 Tax=Stephania cephalantha TaxID=152367 RepID=A0AAP0KS00_9MAGN
MGKLPERSGYSPLDHYHSILKDVLEEGLQSEQLLIRSYGRSFSGFAAKLTEKEQQKIANMEGIVSVFPSVTLKLQTTRSWDFMGFVENVNRVHTVESNTIIGLIDSGVWPESDSFNDEGFGPPPKKWKGVCNGGTNFTCNNKIIGARYYLNPQFIDIVNSTRDTIGHGTHTSSTAAGNQVNHVSLFNGLAEGNARGAVPLSRIAVYKVCWSGGGCPSHAVMAAFDDAISDGVDIISVSLGFASALDYTQDATAIGAFHAMQHGILTSNSAGNNGPSPFSTASVAPWMISVAASTIDRQFVDKVALGDNTTLTGNAIINGFDLKGKMFPLIAAYQAVDLNSCSIEDGRKCVYDCLLAYKIKGKIVLCENATIIDASESVIDVAGVIISQETPFTDYALNFPLPVSLVKISQGEKIISYINTTKNPKATIMKSEAVRDFSAPTVSSFSSRGPNLITSDILKPDITAPGVEIFAAWSPVGLLSEFRSDIRSGKYNIITGTSMACPHVSGVAAYVKTFHPHWSPSAIKSALMTTASPMNVTRNPDREFAYGAGHLNPMKAIDPGLVYEAFEDDYVKMLCSIGYTSEKIKLITGNTSTSSCPPNFKGTAKDLNYPSMAIVISSIVKKEATFFRTVTNVGLANSSYKATVTSPSEMAVSVEPNVLSFNSLNERQSFVVKVLVKASTQQEVISASLVWSDGVHKVRSPIVVYYGKK